MSHWIELQKLAYESSDDSVAKIKQYVLEAQRLRVDLPLIRHYEPKSPAGNGSVRSTRSGDVLKDLKPHDRLLLQLVSRP